MPDSNLRAAHKQVSPHVPRRRKGVRSSVRLLLFLTCLAGTGQSASADETCELSGKPLASLESAQAAWNFVEKHQGALQELQKTGRVPNIQFDRLPVDLNALPAQRIDLFLGLVLPAALLVNAAISAERENLIRLSRKPDLSNSEKQKILRLSRDYGLEGATIPELLKRVDIVPPSLVLAQAADESGWGRSRFALEGNALFGQHTNNPGQRSIAARGANVHLAAFKTLCGSVQAYVSNLNSTRAYAPFRAIRSELRGKHRALSGTALVAGLSQYSERGESYLADLRSIMHHHDLQDLDKARLVGNPRWVRVVHP